MEIHEPFSDLEKQISDMLDQLDKQEPLSTAACKQVVAGLEKIKEYQINPSPKSKKEKIFYIVYQFFSFILAGDQSIRKYLSARLY